MKIYCMKCRKGTENVDPNMIRTKNNRSVMQSKCPVSDLYREQEP